jgi:uncharacterized repeat protein (TIGR01451 family)
VTWNLGTLNPGDGGYIYLTDSVSCDSSGVACIEASISADEADCDTFDNRDILCDSLGSSYDPNDKRVQSQDRGMYVTQEEVTPNDELIYMIRFQNKGTAPAVDIEIRDQLDGNVDMTTVDPVASSHDYDHFEVTQNGTIIWKFDDILLPDEDSDEEGSKGFVAFTVQQQGGNTDGTVIKNDADITFDNNDPITTNKTRNMVVIESVEEVAVSEDANVVLYPNPVHTNATIQVVNGNVPAGGYDLRVYNLLGKEVKHLTQQQTTHIQFSAEELSEGMYFFEFRAQDIVVDSGKFLVK